MPPPGGAKEQLRRALHAQRRAFDPAQKAEWDRRIGARLLAWWHGAQVPELGVYWPLKGEPDLHPAYMQLRAAGVRLALPVVLGRDAALGFALWEPGEAMEKDSFGVAVPAARRMLERPPALVLPCLGYTRERLRLGYGGGFYDRTLEALPRPLTVGVAYACSAVAFDGAAYDVALDVILTEQLRP